MKSEAPSARRFKFSKSEKLHSKKLIDNLFKKGKSFFHYPFKVLHLADTLNALPCNQVLITVSAKKFRKATDRNLIKRRIRESYRLNKYQLEESIRPDIHLMIGYIYVGNEINPFEVIDSKLKQSLQRLKSEYPNQKDQWVSLQNMY